MGASCQVALDLLEQRDRDAQQERPIWRAYLHSVIVSGLNRKERKIGNLLERVDIGTRFLQPIHQLGRSGGGAGHPDQPFSKIPS